MNAAGLVQAARRASAAGLIVALCGACLSDPEPRGGGPGDAGGDSDAGDRDAGDGVDGDVPPHVTQVAVGFAHSCALISDGRVRCWGLNSEGRLGYGNSAT